MIISHQNKFIFIKTAKTAGTSIEIGLSQFCHSNDIVLGLSAEDTLVRQKLGISPHLNTTAPYSNYKFNDWKKLLLKCRRKRLPFRRHSHASEIKSYLGDEIWGKYFKFCFERNPFDRAISFYFWNTRTLSVKPDINTFLQSKSKRELSNWENYTINNQVAVDIVGRYECLDDELAKVIERLGFPKFILPTVNKNSLRTNREHYSHILSPETRAHVENICAHEIDTFGYHWVEI